MEEWRNVVGYEGLYEISNKGNIRSLDRYVNNNGTLELRKGKLLHPSICKGYRIVSLCKDGKINTKRIARLVACAFILNKDNKPHIDHINTVRDDDRVENLRWVTRAENMNNTLTKEKISKSKSKKIMMLTYDGEIQFFDSILQASEQLHITRDTIYRSFNNGVVLNNQVKFYRV